MWVVMEYCDGGTLAQLAKDVTLEEAHVACLSRSILRGLAYLHGRSVVHRDLKAENILLNRSGLLKLGTIHALPLPPREYPHHPALTLFVFRVDRARRRPGPEQAAHRDRGADEPLWQRVLDRARDAAPEEVSPRTLYLSFSLSFFRSLSPLCTRDLRDGLVRCGTKLDIWSFGVVLYEMLQGKPPYYDDGSLKVSRGRHFDVQSAADAWQAMFLMATVGPPRLSVRVSERLSDFLARCMCPAGTRATAAELLEHPFVTDIQPEAERQYALR
jgi:serine/threonine protein kinase